MHKLLARLVKRHIPEAIKDDKLNTFLKCISKALQEQDDDKAFIERSLTLVSDELNEINNELRKNLEENKIYQQQIEEALAKQNALVDTSPEAVFSFYPEGNINQINRMGCEFLGITKQQARALSLTENVGLFLKKIINPEEFLLVLKKINRNNSLKLNGFITTKTGSYYEYYSHPAILDDVYIGRVWCFRDITDIRKNQQLLQKQAYYDSLTNLPNRTLLLKSIEKMIRQSDPRENKVAILFIDLDDFKKINDTAGHEEGDSCLINISHRLQKELRETDTLGRLGGDEFLFILKTNNDFNRVLDVADRILDIFKKPFTIRDHSYVLSVSIGISTYPQDGETSEELIRKADMAMYRAKQKGKNTFYFYDNSLESQAIHRLSVENQLREAIKKQQLLLHYQPKVDLQTGKIHGVEALIRWILPNGKLIHPDSFINIAETTGLIRHITQWVLMTACENLISWQSTALKNTPISINISAIDFSNRTFLDEVFAILDTYKIDPHLLEFELTESVFFDDINWVKHIITELKARHIKISIDDFGTGYSCFSYLQDFDIDYLKIDRSFVQDVHKSNRSLSIVKSIIDIGINLGLEVIAEGIESQSELECLQASGCHHGQGYHFSKPVAEDALLAYAKTSIDNNPIH